MNEYITPSMEMQSVAGSDFVSASTNSGFDGKDQIFGEF